MSKTRIRKKKELLLRKKIFFEITKILDQKKIFYFLQGGVLLGARREKNFIKWDWDVEISVFSKDLIKNFDLLSNELKKKNFKIINSNNTFFRPKISFIKNNQHSTNFAIIGWMHSSLRRAYTRKRLSIPFKFMKKMGRIKFFHKTFYCPSPVDKYLEYQYGDWKKPIRSSNKSLYLSKKFYGNRVNFFDLINTFISSIIKLIR